MSTYEQELLDRLAYLEEQHRRAVAPIIAELRAFHDRKPGVSTIITPGGILLRPCFAAPRSVQ